MFWHFWLNFLNLCCMYTFVNLIFLKKINWQMIRIIHHLLFILKKWIGSKYLFFPINNYCSNKSFGSVEKPIFSYDFRKWIWVWFYKNRYFNMFHSFVICVWCEGHWKIRISTRYIYININSCICICGWYKYKANLSLLKWNAHTP